MAFVTANDMIQDALEALQVYAAGEQLTPPDAARGFGVLNRMIDSWSNESLFCHTIVEQRGQLVANKSAYTISDQSMPIGEFVIGVSPIGPPDWPIQRPLRIIGTPGSAYCLDGNNNKYYVDVVPLDQWNLINTSGNTNADIADTIYYEPSFPYAIMHVYPTPNQPRILVWSSYLQLKRFDNLNAALILPPGYEDAIVTNLALRLKPYFKTAIVDPDLAQTARDAKSAVKRTNIRPVEVVYDAEIVSRGSTVYNIYTDRGTGRN